jgi:large subunit ribosomal protein L9
MKIILSQDVPNLGEMGDVKVVADGYARNFLLPRGFALPHTPRTVAAFAKRQAEIEAHKEEKRRASASLKERIEAEEFSLTMLASANGKLFGAVTSQTVADELLKKGIEVDRKHIEIPDKTIKSAGNYKITIRLYEKEEAVMRLSIIGQEPKKSEPAPERPRRHRREERHEEKPIEESEAGASELTEAGAMAAEGEADQGSPETGEA